MLVLKDNFFNEWIFSGLKKYYSLNLKILIAYALEEISVHYFYLNVVMSSPEANAFCLALENWLQLYLE